MKLSTLALLPALNELRDFLTLAIDLVDRNLEAGIRPTPEAVAHYIDGRMASWDPRIQGNAVLDAPTRAAAARFLAGIACNLLASRQPSRSSA